MSAPISRQGLRLLPFIPIPRTRTAQLFVTWDDNTLRTEVHFKTIAGAFWLPEEVVVNLNFFGEIYRNTHHYSQFRLFNVETQEIPGSKQQAPGAPKNPQ